MVIKANEMPQKESEMRGGNGTIQQVQVVIPAQMIHARLFNKLTIKKDCSIGYHVHNNEVEYYYILSGEGIVTEPDGEKTVNAGDVVITGWGVGHSIRNEKSEDLVLLAIISTEA